MYIKLKRSYVNNEIRVHSTLFYKKLEIHIRLQCQTRKVVYYNFDFETPFFQSIQVN